ncbi:MAG: HEAT repeat domain-containing protein, partial [Planctomycetota bacterium JB042]
LDRRLVLQRPERHRRRQPHPTVREEAAVVCGERHWLSTADALRARLDDDDWRVRLAAAVSLGSLQDEAAIEPLKARLASSGEWRERATAATGLGRIGRREVVPALIEALDDADPMVKAIARDYLKRLCLADLPADPAPWRKWWEANEKKFSFQDRNRRYEDARDEKYAYGDFKRRPYGALADIDVIVLGGGNDGIEKYLAAATIAHRMTAKGEVKASGLNPNAVFIANCPGQLDGDDPDRIEWFVHSGGYVFATCWGLTRTVARVFPGIIHAERMEADRSSVDADPAAPESPLLEDVVAPHTELQYGIAGYQLIVVDDPERFEVLIDSEAADAQWGQGNLFGWFRAGHGVVADSTNHFTLQGMDGLKFGSADERMAYAFERLGYDFERLRELREEGVFKKDRSAADAVDDQSFLRLMARFVHLRRKVDG